MREVHVKKGDFYKGPLLDIRLGGTGAIASYAYPHYAPKPDASL